MTDLERLRARIYATPSDMAEANRIIDAHLKEDAEREHKYELVTDMLEAQLTELREAVREHLYRHHREGGAARLRKLSEEKS